MGRDEDAIKDFTKAIEINPLFAEAYYNRGKYNDKYLLGVSLDNLGRKEEAIKDYIKAIEINP